MIFLNFNFFDFLYEFIYSTNVITELFSLDMKLDIEEPKTTALQTLTAAHTDDIATNTANI
jgi:hypothetical protein